MGVGGRHALRGGQLRTHGVNRARDTGNELSSEGLLQMGQCQRPECTRVLVARRVSLANKSANADQVRPGGQGKGKAWRNPVRRQTSRQGRLTSWR